MGSVIEYSTCDCGNPDKYSDYYYKSDELYESCDVCGYYHSVYIKNRPKDKDYKYPPDWKPEYVEKEGRTGFVVKVFGYEGAGHSVGFIEESQVENIIDQLQGDTNVKMFGITYKNDKGNYLTQIYNNDANR